jgi:ankyrin repeat protein
MFYKKIFFLLCAASLTGQLYTMKRQHDIVPFNASPTHNEPTIIEPGQFFDYIKTEQIKEIEDALSKGFDPNTQYNNSTALMYAIQLQRIEAVKALIREGADVELSTTFGDFPLFEATFTGNHEITQLLLQNNANPDREYKPGLTSLHLASAKNNNNNSNIIEKLIGYGADVNKKNNITGSTPLMYTVDNGNLPHFLCLLANGASINSKNNQGLNINDLITDEKGSISSSISSSEEEDEQLNYDDEQLNYYDVQLENQILPQPLQPREYSKKEAVRIMDTLLNDKKSAQAIKINRAERQRLIENHFSSTNNHMFHFINARSLVGFKNPK